MIIIHICFQNTHCFWFGDMLFLKNEVRELITTLRKKMAKCLLQKMEYRNFAPWLEKDTKWARKISSAGEILFVPDEQDFVREVPQKSLWTT